MSDNPPPPQFTPRFRHDVYPFIHPAKFRGSLRDRVAVITGSAGAFGRALAESFAVAGARLVLSYFRTEPPPELAARCRALGAGGVLFVRCDVSLLEGCRELVRKALEVYGRVDVLVNNAGANGLGPLDAQEPDDFVRDVAVNFHGPYYLMRLLLPHFRGRRSGCVVNVASRAGTVAVPYSASYCASKAALISLTACTQKEMDVEGLDDIHLYALHPGGIKSAMTLKKYAADSVAALPEPARARFAGLLDAHYNDSPYLGAMVCVALAAGVGKRALRGRYLDAGHDLEDVLAQADALAADPDLHMLHTRFLGGLPNDGGPPAAARRDPAGEGEGEGEEGRFEFPGFEVEGLLVRGQGQTSSG